MEILLADKQDITRAGLMYVLESFDGVTFKCIEDKAELLLALQKDSNRVVVLDYTLFDINDAAELMILCERFVATHWLLFSEDLSLDFVRLAKVQYTSLIVHVTPDSTNAELLMTLSDELARRGSQNIYRLQIKGLRDPDVVFDLDTLRQRFRIAELFDYSEPKYDFSRLFAEHSSDMIGFFIQELDKPDLSLLDKKALYYGVSALLHTTGERGQKT